MMGASVAGCPGYDICTTAGGNWLAVAAGAVLIYLVWRYAP